MGSGILARLNLSSGEARTAFIESESIIWGKNVSSRPAGWQTRGARAETELKRRTWQRCCRMVTSSPSGMSPTWSSKKRLRKARDSTCVWRVSGRHGSASQLRWRCCINDFGFSESAHAALRH